MRFVAACFCLLLTLCGALAQFEKAAFVPPRKWALVIGGGKYAELGDLRFAARDATAFAQLLREDFHFSPDSISLLADEEGQTPPTTKNVKDELDRLLADKRLNKGDLFVVFFSGHGVGTPRGDYLALTDAKTNNIEEAGLPVKNLVTTLVNAGLRNVLFIADACRGGTQNSFGEELTALSERSNLALMLSCLPGKRSMESPRDRHGFFTAALLKGLKDPALRDAKSGALWASSVAVFVEKEVAERTEVRLGEASKQVPASFADDRRDVMLAAFLPPNVDGETLEALRKSASEKDADRQALALNSYADALYAEDRFDEAAELLRIVDGLGKLDDAARMTLGFALQNAGRSKESQIVLGADFKDPFIKLVVRALNDANPNPADRVAAAKEAFALHPTFDFAFAGDEVMAASASQKDHLDFLHGLKSIPMSAQSRTYFEGRIAEVENKPKEAIAAYREALNATGIRQVSPELVRMRLFVFASRTGQAEVAKEVCEGARKEDSKSGLWPLLLAQAKKAEGKEDESVALLREALGKEVTPSIILVALTLAGKRAPDINALVIAAADKYPRAWKARLAKILSEAMQGGIDPVKAAQAFEQASRYVDDPKLLALAADSTLEPIIEEAFLEGRLEGSAYALNQIARAGTLSLYADEFGADPEAWFALIRAHLRSFRTMRAWDIVDRHLGAQYREGKLPAPLRGIYTIAALNAGQFDLVAKLVAEGGFAPADRQDAGWFAVAALIAAGKDLEAAEKLKNLPDPSPQLKNVAAAFRAYLDPKAKPMDIPIEEPVGVALRGLKFASAKDWPNAEPSLGESAAGASWGFQVIHFHALGVLNKWYRDNGKSIEAQNLGFLSQDAFLCHPLLGDFSMAAKPSISAYAKSWKFKARMVDEGFQAAEVEIELTIDEKGQLKGKVDGDAEITGQVDLNGNGEVRITFDGETFKGPIKAPAMDYDLGQNPLTWLISHANGRCLTLYLTPDKVPASSLPAMPRGEREGPSSPLLETHIAA